MAANGGKAVNALYQSSAASENAKGSVITTTSGAKSVPDAFMKEMRVSRRARLEYDYTHFANLPSDEEASLRIAYVGNNE